MAAGEYSRKWIALAFTAIAVVCLLSIAIIDTGRSYQRERSVNHLILHAHQVSGTLRDTLSCITDAETGQRGYLLTNNSRYLNSFYQGRKFAPIYLDKLELETRDNPLQQHHMLKLRSAVSSKLAEMSLTVVLDQEGNSNRAMAIIDSGKGQRIMEQIRTQISEMQTIESNLLDARMAASSNAARVTLAAVSGGLTLAVVILIIAVWTIALLVRGQIAAEQRIRDFNTVLTFQKDELERANTEMEALATTDSLTGLKNHRAFHERFADEVSRFARHGTPLSIIVLDVDRFKQFNDAHGHIAGDAVLRELSRILMDCARETDLAARYGGEEFVMLLRDTDIEGAAAFAERLRSEIENHPWQVRAITASFGVASLRLKDESGEVLFARADAAMYRSKAAGRNLVTCALDLMPIEAVA